MYLPYPPPLATGKFKIVRKRPKDQWEHIETYAVQTGHVLWEWNAAHAQLFHVFWLLMGEPREKADGVWQVTNSDDLQRKMLLALAGEAWGHSNLAKHRKAYRHLKWIIKAINDIAVYRNVATHIPMVFFEDDGGETAMMPDPYATRLPSSIRQVYAQYGKIFEKIAGDLCVLGQYTLAISIKAGTDRTVPWPRRPQLRSLPEIRAANSRAEALSAQSKQRRLRRALRKRASDTSGKT